MILLDTNVVSEMMKPEPAARVVSWMEREPASSLYVTSITQAEIMHGVMLLPQGRRRKALEAAAQAMFSEDFAERLLAFGSEAALARSEEHTSELQSPCISYAVFCLKNKNLIAI